MRYTISVLFFISSLSLTAQNTLNDSLAKYFKTKAEKYLDKEKTLTGFYSIDKGGIKMFASLQNKQNNIPEFVLPYTLINEFTTAVKQSSAQQLLEIYKSGTPEKVYTYYPTPTNTPEKLKGLKIAIDAGHIAADVQTGKTEIKCIQFKIKDEKQNTDSIAFAEGMLTYATAQLLKQKLQTQGAEVLLTRNCNGCTAFGKTIDEWLKQDYKATIDSLYKTGSINEEKRKYYLSPKCSKRDKFKSILKDIDLQKRAELINNFHPDFTVIIHYNVDETNTGWVKPSSKNYVMTFVGGAFMKNDLSSADKRMEFLRLLVTDDLEQSITLSSIVTNSFKETLKVPIAQKNDAKYLREGCIATEKNGVYCRNLQLTRYIHSPLVYGETLYQDNINECKLLNQEKDKTKNKRVQQVVEAYFIGISNYVLQLRK